MDKIKIGFAAAALLGVFALCGVSVYQGQLDVKAAIGIALASLTSIGSLTGLYKSED
jgi:hypothetical protein